jgi:hypothetical protein
MAAITSDAARQTGGRFEAVLIVLRQMLDAFVGLPAAASRRAGTSEGFLT